MQPIADIRKEYKLKELTEASVATDPFLQFGRWWDEAMASHIDEVNAMTLATVSPDGLPEARIVLLKGVDNRGFVFYTNYDSHKGAALAAHPQACLLFFWKELERQVRITGSVEKVSPEESDAYFHSRPEGSQLGAWASPQSQVIDGRSVLDKNLESYTTRFSGAEVPRPPHWGGYRVHPDSVEFWQGRPSRLHDRLLYRWNKAANAWSISRLAP
ncbi:pyridoxamine 5'-phosphate oxidase [Dinghuibacter silviterrae]|uniref:Pyridoxine/pyridoxamine 5'-phosphate oxidase n=1 Tax=Dinghuibacter silviterrae TaxID=1539049 RepID=A0A4R8DP91_9BACT|nr:pyridoxamine 5'-phosphate oxidase [Dinghuibacter silviterrae]TDW99891.1 pyridoxamine 5'-phosphate oxidase [Dinghuibacter silviterrae]